MWLIVSAVAALVATAAWAVVPRGKYRLGGLSLAFWGLTFMIFVDHVIGWFLEGAEGEFLEVSLEAFMLSLCMIIPIFAIWELYVVIDKLKADRVGSTCCSCNDSSMEV
ncbi:MAG: hypothetical protein ACI38Y_05935 [Candidatus Methanomethylophilaceae archaeon]